MSSAKRWGDNVITEFTAISQAGDYHQCVRWGTIIWEVLLSMLILLTQTLLDKGCSLNINSSATPPPQLNT